MFKRLDSIPEGLGNINGVEFEANIPVKITTNKKLRQDVCECLSTEENKAISLDKKYIVNKIKAYGDVFDVTIINDLGQEEEFGSWFFEDIEE